MASLSKSGADYKKWKERHVNDSYETYLDMRADDAKENTERAIRDSYTPLYENYDSQLEKLPGRRDEQESYIDEIYGQNYNTIGADAENASSKVDTQIASQGMQQETALRDIAGDIRNSMQAGNRYLGVRGATDSSASGQMSYALQKAGAKAGSDVRSQYASNIGDLEQAKADIEYEALGARNELSQWKTTSLMEVSTWFQDQWDSIEAQKAGAQASEAQQLASMQAGILQQTLSTIAQIDTMNAQNEINIKNWEKERTASLEDYRKQLEIQSEFTTSPYSYNSSIGSGQTTKTNSTNSSTSRNSISTGIPGWLA